MAFFDEAGRKIKEAGQDVAQTTRNLTSTMKLNSAISEDEKNLTRLFCAVGQEYFGLHGDEPEEALAANIEKIKETKAHIEECKAQLLKLKGHILCPSCGEEIADTSVFCNFCGVKLPEREEPSEEPAPTEEAEPIEAPAPLICPECGAAYKKGSMYCIFCGHMVGVIPEKKPEAPAPGAKPYPTMKASDHTDGKPFPTVVASERAEMKEAVEEVKEAVEAVPEEVCEACGEVKEAVEAVPEEVCEACEEVKEAVEAVPEEVCEEVKEAVEAVPREVCEACEEVKEAVEAVPEEVCEACEEVKEAVEDIPEEPDSFYKAPPEICGGPIPGFVFEPTMAQAFADGRKPDGEPKPFAQGTIFPIGYDPGKKPDEADHMLDGPGSEQPLVCKNCGAVLKPTAKFCTMCGERVTPPEDPNKIKCSLCGAELNPGQRFCTTCGTRVES